MSRSPGRRAAPAGVRKRPATSAVSAEFCKAFPPIFKVMGELLLLWQGLCLSSAHMKTSHLGLLGLVLCAAPLGACNETAVGTDTVRTKGLWASIEVKSTGPSTKLTAELRVGGSRGTPAYPLTGADELLVSVDGSAEVSLDETCPDENTFCTGNLGNISGKEVRLNFDRGSEQENAPNSTVTMPEAFEVSAKDQDVVRGEEDVLLTITGNSRSLEYKVSGSCIWTEEGTVTDGKIPASAITSPNSDQDEDCDVNVVVRRTSVGDLDPNFGKGGHIVAVQERKFTFFSVAKVTPPVGSPDAGDSSSTNEPDSSSTGTTSAPDAGGDAAVSSDGGSSSSDTATDGGVDASTDAAATGSGDTSANVSDAGDAG